MIDRKIGPEGLMWADDREDFTLGQKVRYAIKAFKRRFGRDAIRVSVNPGDATTMWATAASDGEMVATTHGVPVHADKATLEGHIFVT